MIIVILLVLIINVNSFSKPINPLVRSFNNKFKELARDWFIERAESKGIEWVKMKDYYEKNIEELEKHFNYVNNESITYPDYYKKPFHAYEEGNLNWLASLENEASTLSMSSNYYDNLDPYDTADLIRSSFLDHIKEYNEKNREIEIKSVLDVGCSTGISSEYVYKYFNRIKLTGIDLSPYFLSVAKFNSLRKIIPITYIHNNAESMEIKNDSQDLVTCSYMFHELPPLATKKILKEIKRVLKPGGIVAIIDLDPNKLKKNIAKEKFNKIAFEMTEPHIETYYEHCMTSDLFLTGYTNIDRFDNDPYNSIWIASKDGNSIESSDNNRMKEFKYLTKT